MSTPVRASGASGGSNAAVAALLLNALIWGVSWWPFRYLEARGLSSLWTTAFIYLVGALLLLAWLGVRRDAANRHEPIFVKASIPALVALALAGGLTNACFNWSVTTGSVVRVVLLFYLMPIWAVLLARWLLNEPITGSAIARIALALAGAVAILWRPELGMPWPQSWPDGLAIVGGAGFALTNVLLRRLHACPPLTRALAMFIGSGALSCVLAASLSASALAPWPSGMASAGAVSAGVVSSAPLWPAWLPGALLMTVIFLVSNLALQYGAARLPANVTAVVMLSEVLFASISAIVFGNETITPALLVGGALVVLAAWLASVERPRAQQT